MSRAIEKAREQQHLVTPIWQPAKRRQTYRSTRFGAPFYAAFRCSSTGCAEGGNCTSLAPTLTQPTQEAPLQEYKNDKLVVRYDPAICIHAGECVRAFLLFSMCRRSRGST